VSDAVAPALTPDEWDARTIDRDDLYASFTEAIVVTRTPGDRSTLAVDGDRHALAAAMLYGQLFGFTSEELEFLTTPNNFMDGCGWFRRQRRARARVAPLESRRPAPGAAMNAEERHIARARALGAAAPTWDERQRIILAEQAIAKERIARAQAKRERRALRRATVERSPYADAP
jgi:hypothetical protein